jgi:hypothetical protein
VFGFLVAICVFSNFSKIFLLGKKAREALNKVSGCKIRVMLPWYLRCTWRNLRFSLISVVNFYYINNKLHT